MGRKGGMVIGRIGDNPPQLPLQITVKTLQKSSKITILGRVTGKEAKPPEKRKYSRYFYPLYYTFPPIKPEDLHPEQAHHAIQAPIHRSVK